MKQKLTNLFQQFIKFGMVGVSNTVISYAAAALYLLIFGDTVVNALIGNFIGFVLSVINSYFWNSRFVFKNKSEDNGKKAFAKVVVSYGLSLLLST
ncbi:MAG: GtrA family protein, partial [Ruminococcus sp.]|nr:GtrA family protein [Ruminococcus sp.]